MYNILICLTIFSAYGLCYIGTGLAAHHPAIGAAFMLLAFAIVVKLSNCFEE